MRIFSILALAALGLAGLSHAEKAKKPNILFLLSDDQSWGDYGFMGHEHIDTPVIDKLAQESLTYTRGYTPVPLCRPSLATIVTGLFPQEHGVTGNDPVWGKADGTKGGKRALRSELNKDLVKTFNKSPNIMHALKENGYLTEVKGNPIF